jgi:uncharacterized protein YdeI (YjbR/CyaY-like superfamily)
MNDKVNNYLIQNPKWQIELEKIRNIIVDTQLIEDFKWRVPCYTFQNKNVIILNALKDCCVVGFLKGALLNDSNKVLVQQTENMQSARIIKFHNIQEIVAMESLLKKYIYEAIEVEKAGLKVVYKKTSDFVIVKEFQNKLAEIPELKSAFENLTPGRQKAYLLHFAAPKQAKTRETRIEKSIPQILNGKGINDCTCGLSKKMPYCDGSHKYI